MTSQEKRVKVPLSCGTVLDISEHDLVNLEHYKQAAEYNRKYSLPHGSPPVKTPKVPKVANIQVRGGELMEVTYSRKFNRHGFTWFIHRTKKGEKWKLSNWETGHRAGAFWLQGECYERIGQLTPSEIASIKGAVSLHGGANPSVKKGGKS